MNLDLNDLKTVILSLTTGITGGLIVLGIARYWSNRSIKNMKRRIEATEAQKTQINNLAKSDRALLLYGFGNLFVLLVFLSVAILLSEVMLMQMFLGEM